jgi:multiple sugar transport system ATP-binding protein
MAQIELRQVSKRYGQALPLTINTVDLDIAQGEFCVFVGPSGCGKSTLLRMVAGLEAISEGELRIGGERMNDVAPAQRGVAMVFQSYALYPHMTVFENMAFGLQVSGVAAAEVDRKVREAAAILQLGPLLARKPKALSGGQRQRVAIGRAIVKQPRVFLFDEPLSNLDAALRAATRIEIARLHREVGSASMIYVTHDQVEAMTLAQKIVLLHSGERIATHGSVAQVGTPMALYHRPASLFVAEFIGSARINVLPATLRSAQSAHAVVDVAGQAVTAAVNATRLAAGSAVSLAVRPEHLRLVAGGAAGSGGDGHRVATFDGRIVHVERLGDSTLLYLELAAGGALTVRADDHDAHTVGDAVGVAFDAQALHLFDAEGVACERSAAVPR